MAEALSPIPPHQTVRSVFPNTAFQLSSTTGFRRSSPGGSRWNFIKAQDFVIIFVRERSISKAMIMMLPTYVDTHSIAQIISQSRHCRGTVAIVEVTHPASDDFVHSSDYYFSRRCAKPFSGQLPDFKADMFHRLLRWVDKREWSTALSSSPHYNAEPQEVKALPSRVYYSRLCLIQA